MDKCMSCEREFRYLAISEAQNYFSMCHASNLLRLKDGTILTVFFAGTHEGESDTAIYSCRAKEGESSQPKLISQSNEAHWNPVLFLPDENQDKEIVLFFKVGNIIASWRTMITRSHDGGISWDIPKELVIGDKGGRGPVRNKPIRTSSGAILCPASLEDGVWRSFVDISTDELASLHKSNEIFYTQAGSFSPKSKDIEAQVVRINPLTGYESAHGAQESAMFVGHMFLHSKTGEATPLLTNIRNRSVRRKLYRSASSCASSP